MIERFNYNSHCVYNIGYHIIWCPKYRRRILRLGIDELVHGLKGYTANILRHEYPWLRRLPCLWSRSYYVESIGHISEETVRRYIEDQKETANRKAGSLSSHS